MTVPRSTRKHNARRKDGVPRSGKRSMYMIEKLRAEKKDKK